MLDKLIPRRRTPPRGRCPSSARTCSRGPASPTPSSREPQPLKDEIDRFTDQGTQIIVL